jgi:hypothetical protein
MRWTYLVTALFVVFGVTARAESGNEPRSQNRFPLMEQGVERSAAEAPRTLVRRRRHPIPDASALPVSFDRRGQGFTCDQIRIMDEVELITDDSYCE